MPAAPALPDTYLSLVEVVKDSSPDAFKVYEASTGRLVAFITHPGARNWFVHWAHQADAWRDKPRQERRTGKASAVALVAQRLAEGWI